MVVFYYMTYLEAIVLGFIEGATEFIPVSSSGHLIVVRELLGMEAGGGLAFDAVLQLSASLALLVYFYADILRILRTAWDFVTRKAVAEVDKTLLFGIGLGTIPAVIAGLFLEESMETIFRNVDLVAVMLILGSGLFWISQKVGKQNRELTLTRAISIGFFQCLALVPGVSRSGATISGGLLAGLSRTEAVRFSFLLSIPVIFGAGLKKFFEVRNEIFAVDTGMLFLVGSLVAFVTSLVAIGFLIRYLKNHDLNLFIWYRIGLAIAILVLL